VRCVAQEIVGVLFCTGFVVVLCCTGDGWCTVLHRRLLLYCVAQEIVGALCCTGDC
jgi:hypothetical protein